MVVGEEERGVAEVAGRGDSGEAEELGENAVIVKIEANQAGMDKLEFEHGLAGIRDGEQRRRRRTRRRRRRRHDYNGEARKCF